MRIVAFSDWRVQPIDVLFEIIKDIDNVDAVVYAGDDLDRFDNSFFLKTIKQILHRHEDSNKSYISKCGAEIFYYAFSQCPNVMSEDELKELAIFEINTQKCEIGSWIFRDIVGSRFKPSDGQSDAIKYKLKVGIELGRVMDIDGRKIIVFKLDNQRDTFPEIDFLYLYSWTINPNVKYYQIPSKSQFPNPKKKGLAKIRYKTGSIGIWDLFGSIGIYWIFGFSTELNKYDFLNVFQALSEKANAPVLGVIGNDDTEGCAKTLIGDNIFNIHKNPIEICERYFLGVQGVICDDESFKRWVKYKELNALKHEIEDFYAKSLLKKHRNDAVFPELNKSLSDLEALFYKERS
ncbi:MAG: hypothetical protein QMD22_04395 [archaeon]|nr:hypothetical protein [archaeon]